jgi:hypothetical protein
MSILDFLLAVGVAVGLGVVIAVTYLVAHREERSAHLPVVLVVLPAIIATVIVFIGDNIAGAFSLAGIFALIKFRSAPTDARNIVFVLLCLAPGLACGVGEYGRGPAVTVVLCGVIVVAGWLKIGVVSPLVIRLTILVPEDVDFGCFDRVVKKYAVHYRLVRTRTRELGSLYELNYCLKLRRGVDRKRLMDEVRRYNGNLKVMVVDGVVESEF